MENDILKFKQELEKALLITKWNPTEEQLIKIKNKISKLKPPIKTIDIKKIILEEYGTFECIVLEGIDNSDLSLLLRLASNTND